MRAVLTAVIAAIEAAAVALAVFAVIGVPAVLIWWIGFDLGAEPADLAAIIAALWQMTHLVPLQLTVTAADALAMGLSAEAISFTVSLAPLALTAGTVVLAYRSGTRFAERGGRGAWALLGGAVGFTLAAGFSGALAATYTVWPQPARILVPLAVYLLPMVFGFVLRAANDGHEWWENVVRSVQRGVSRFAQAGAASLPERTAETLRLTAGSLAAMLALGALSCSIAIVTGYVEIITVSQSLQLDVFGVLMLFLLQLAYLPTAWVWAISWFAGSGFSVGAATSVTPFDTLLGPLPVLPLFGAIPNGWGWAGGIAPVIIVVIGTVLGGLAGGRPLMRRASALVSVLVPICAAVLAGAVIALCSVLASGAIGPGRLSMSGPGWWQTGGLIALELAFGMSLGIFARRFDVARVRAMIPASLRDDEYLLRSDDFSPRDSEEYLGRARPLDVMGGMGSDHEEDHAETMPVDPYVEALQAAQQNSLSNDYHEQPQQFGRDAGGDSRREGLTADDQLTAEIEPLVSFDGFVSVPEVGLNVTADGPQQLASHLPEPEQAGLGPTAPEAEFEPRSKPEPELAGSGPVEPEAELRPEPEPEPEPEEAVDPLLRAFSWDAQTPEAPQTPAANDWRSRMRSKLGRGKQ